VHVRLFVDILIDNILDASKNIVMISMFRCSRCGKCCEMTEMELSKDDIGRLERMGYSREEFSTIGDDGIPRLRNVGRWCCFYDSVKKLCQIYGNRPLGCRLYPIVYSIYGWVTVDQLCPMNFTISQDELRAKERELIELVKTIESEAACTHEEKCG